MEFDACSSCGFVHRVDRECPRCANRPVAGLPAVRAADTQLDTTIRSSRGVDRLALPAAIGFVPLAKLTFVPWLILQWLCNWLHEFGHSFVGWFSSRAATPLALGPGFAWTSTEKDKSWVVFCCFVFLIGVVGYRALREKSRLLTVVSALLLLATLIFTFVLTDRQYRFVMSWSGIAGEFIFGALLCIGYHHPLPKKWRWDFFRFPALVIGAASLTDQTYKWLRIRAKKAEVPWGTGIWGAKDANGDMNRLLLNYGYGEPRLVRAYLSLAVVCWIAVIINYVMMAFFVSAPASRTDTERTDMERTNADEHSPS